MMKLRQSQIVTIAIDLGIKIFHSKVLFLRKFRSLFGMSCKVVTKTWNSLQLQNLLPAKADPKHLLWMCAFLKSYDSENVYATRFKVDEKTFRKWVWIMLEAVSKLEVVSRKKWLFLKMFYFWILLCIIFRCLHGLNFLIITFSYFTFFFLL